MSSPRERATKMMGRCCSCQSSLNMRLSKNMTEQLTSYPSLLSTKLTGRCVAWSSISDIALKRSIRVVYEDHHSSTAKVRREGIFRPIFLSPGISPCSSRITLQPMDCNATKGRKHRFLQHLNRNRLSISLNFDFSTVSRIAAGMKNVKAHCSGILSILKGSLETYRQENLVEGDSHGLLSLARRRA